MSTLANITSLNLSLQTGGAALAVNAVKSVAKPERTVYVFGTADDVAPNFTTLDGAVTYARSLVPDPDEPVVIRLFTKLDGTPYDLDGGDSWIVYAFESIYIYSDFKRLNTITDELPTSLPAGLTIWYIDPNGVETLWVGNEDGIAWPAVGYKEYVASVTWDSGSPLYIATPIVNQLPGTTTITENDGFYAPGFRINNTSIVINNATASINSNGEPNANVAPMYSYIDNNSVSFGTNDAGANSFLNQVVSIRIYP
jgi:hypothetical protein